MKKREAYILGWLYGHIARTMPDYDTAAKTQNSKKGERAYNPFAFRIYSSFVSASFGLQLMHCNSSDRYGSMHMRCHADTSDHPYTPGSGCLLN